jgi:hypothetical protein
MNNIQISRKENIKYFDKKKVYIKLEQIEIAYNNNATKKFIKRIVKEVFQTRNVTDYREGSQHTKQQRESPPGWSEFVRSTTNCKMEHTVTVEKSGLVCTKCNVISTTHRRQTRKENYNTTPR